MTKCPLDPAVAAVRGARIGVEDAALTQLQSVLAWTEAHRVDQVKDADTYRTSAGILGSIDTGISLAGEGAPMVEEFACHDLACAMARTPDSTQAYVGNALELVHRLPALWRQVQRRRIVVGMALRMAEQTISLSREAVAFVDTQIAWCAGSISWAQLERTVAEAVARFDPERAEREAAEAAERRRFDIDFDQRGLSGLADVAGCLDVEDALDLEAAIATRAATWASSDVRSRSRCAAPRPPARSPAKLWGNAPCSPTRPRRSTRSTIERQCRRSRPPWRPLRAGVS